MAKHVFPTYEIPHLWAHKTQDDARNAAGNLFFTGRTIYSYGSHFPIAQHVENKRGERAILLTTRTYSVTTSGHVSAVRSCIPSGILVFNVPLQERWYRADASEAHEEHIRNYQNELNELAGKAAKSRKYRESCILEMTRKYEEAKRYCEFYRIKHKFTVQTADKLDELAKNIRATERAAREQQKRQAAQRQAAAIRQAEEQIARFRNGQNYENLWNVPAMLRIKGTEVETSRGARVPLAHALRAYTLLKLYRANGKTYERNGHTIHLGHYAIDSFDGETLRAGCHAIAWPEIVRTGEVLMTMDIPRHSGDVQTA